MGTTDYGTQTITFRYNQALISSDLGKLLYNITKPGIYDGGNLTINSGNNVNIAPLDLLVETSALQMMHVKTTTNIVFPITESTPYITCQFTWVDSTTNYMDFTAKAVGDLLTSDVVVGMGVYVASTLTSFSYTSKTWGTFDRSGNMRSTNVIAATDVTILGANGLYNSTKALTTYGNTTVAKTANYVMLDNDGYSRIECDTTSNAITITLPAVATNRGRRIEIALVKNDASLDKVIIQGAAGSIMSEDLLAAIWLTKVGDFICVQESATSGAWNIVNERITSQLKLNTYAGYGSTDNKIMRFTNVVTNFGNMFSENHVSGYTANAKGLEITINRSGRYAISFSAQGGAATNNGLSLNSTELTTSLETITVTDRLVITVALSSCGSITVNMFFKKNDIIRPHTAGLAPASNNALTHFNVEYIGN